ncbi:MAG: integrase/recombinase XerD [Actinomycetota bacterium]
MHLADLVSDYSAWLRDQGRADNTVGAYARDVAAYLRWRETTPGADLASYVTVLQDTRASSSAARAVVALRIFHRWHDEDELSRPELAGLPTGSSRTEPDIDEATMALLLRATDGDSVGRRRDAIAIGLLYLAGLKVSEAISLDVADVLADGAVLAVDREGPHERVLPAVPALHETMRRWLADGGRPRLHPTTNALLVNRRGQRLTRQGLWLLMGGVARRAGVAERLAPNDLRRACANHLAGRGLAPGPIGAFLGQTRGAPPSVSLLNACGWGSCNLVV